MPTSAQLAQALQAADAAGNTDDATQLAQAYKQQLASEQSAAPVQTAQATGNQLPTTTASPTADDYRNAGMNVPDKLRTSDESFMQKLNDVGNDAGDAFVHHLFNPVVGVAQLGAHGIDTALQSSVFPQSVQDWAAKDKTQGDKDVAQYENDYQKSVPTNTASTIGAGVGEALPFALEAPGKALQYIGDAAKFLPESGNIVTRLGNKILSGAAQGATVAAAQPVTSGPATSSVAALVSGEAPVPSFASQKLGQLGVGAATGGTLPIAGEIAGGVGNLVRHVTNPQAIAAQNIARLVGSDPATLAKLDSASAGNISGVVPTTAQAAPSATAVAAEKALSNTPTGKLALVERQTDNNAARMAVLQQHAGDDASMQAAKDARSAAVQPFVDQYLQPNQNLIDPSKVLQAAAMTRNTGLGARPAVRDALDRISTTINESKNSDGLVPADILDSVRQNINDFLVSPTGKRATPQEALGVAPIRDQLVQTIGQHAPGYADYLATYAKHSEPINTMQAAQSILDRVNTRTLNSADAAPLSLNDINQGLKSIDKGRYGVSPQAQSDLQGIQDSLKREGISNSIRSPGSDTAYNLNAQGSLASNLLGPTLQGPTGKTRGIAALIGTVVGDHLGGLPGAGIGAGIGTFINKGADVINQRIMNAYTKGMLNPDEAATLIRTYLKGNSSQASKLLGKYPQWNALLSGSSAQQVQKANP